MHENFYLIKKPTTQCQLGPYLVSKNDFKYLDTRLSTFKFSKAYLALLINLSNSF